MNYLRRHRMPRHSAVRQRPTLQLRQRGKVSMMPLLLLAGVVVVGAFYIFQVNTVASGGLTLRTLERHLVALKSENEELDVRTAGMRSLTIIDHSPATADLTAHVQPTYLPATTNAVALRP